MREKLKQEKLVEKEQKLREKEERKQQREQDKVRKKAKRIRELQEKIGSNKKVKYKDKDEEKLGKIAESLSKGKHGTRIKTLKRDLEDAEKRDRELKKKEESFRNRRKYPVEDSELDQRLETLKPQPTPHEPVLDGVPSNNVGELLFVWDFIHRFCKILNLAPIPLENLRSGLLYTEDLPLISQLHYQLLTLILADREDDDYVSDEDDEFDQDDRWHYEARHAPLTMGAPTSLVLNHITWPIVLKNLILAVPRFNSAASPNLKAALSALDESEYPSISLCHKLQLLSFMVNRAYATQRIRKYLRASLEERIYRSKEFNKIEAKERRVAKEEEERIKEQAKQKKIDEEQRQKESMENWMKGGQVGPSPDSAEAVPTPAPSPTGSAASVLSSNFDTGTESGQSDDEGEEEKSIEGEISRNELLQKRRENQERREAKRLRREERVRKKKWAEQLKKKRESVLEDIKTSIEEKDLDLLNSAIERARDAGLESGRGDRLWQAKELIDAIDIQKRLETELERETEALKRREEFEAAMSEHFIRTKFLGMDKDFSRYWFFEGDSKRLYVEKRFRKLSFKHEVDDQEGVDRCAPEKYESRWFCYRTRVEVDDLIESLDVRGIREKHLKQSLMTHADDIKQDMPGGGEDDMETAETTNFLEWNESTPEIAMASIESLQDKLRKLESWICDRLETRGSNWKEAQDKQPAFKEMVDQAKSVARLADPLLLLETAVFQLFEKQTEKGASASTSKGNMTPEESNDEDDDDDDDVHDDEPIVDDGSQLWPTHRSRERWRDALKRCVTMSALAVATETLIQRCDIVGISEVEHEDTRKNRRAKTEDEKRSRKERAVRRKAEEVEEDEVDDREEVDNWEENCYVCGVGGELLCCDGCTKVFHLECVGLRRIPRGEIFCDGCKSPRKVPRKRVVEKVEEEEVGEEEDTEEEEETEAEDEEADGGETEEEKDQWDTMCATCNAEGELLCCDGCPKAFHITCIGLKVCIVLSDYDMINPFNRNYRTMNGSVMIARINTVDSAIRTG